MKTTKDKESIFCVKNLLKSSTQEDLPPLWFSFRF